VEKKAGQVFYVSGKKSNEMLVQDCSQEKASQDSIRTLK